MFMRVPFCITHRQRHGPAGSISCAHLLSTRYAVAAFSLARLIQSQLFEVKAHDPLVYLLSVGLIGLVALLSVYLPARRAARVNPIVALRAE